MDKDLDSVSSLPSSVQGRSRHPKPGVILLGRGNSFSLGRSEVILLHHRRKPTKGRRSNDGDSVHSSADKAMVVANGENDNDDAFHPMRSIEERVNSSKDIVSSQTLIGETVSDDYPPVPSPSPPPISNGVSHPDIQVPNGEFVDLHSDDILVPCYQDNLQDLWLLAESVMKRRNDCVRKNLEKFGIGEPGGGGGEDDGNEQYWHDDSEDRKGEEDQVWSMIECNVSL